MTATDRLRALLDERGYPHTLRPELHGALDAAGIGYWVTQGLTFWDCPDGRECVAYGYQVNGKPKLAVKIAGITDPEQAVAATLGPAYVPPIDAHWDGDVLVLTTQRDPSSIHVQRAEGHPRKVYPAEATLGPGTCDGDANALLRDTRAENAKLRELCADLYEFAMDEYPEGTELAFADSMREFGIEVDAWM